MTWTPIPPWLYQNGLPDEQLQEVYVRALRKKVGEIGERLADLDEQRDALCQQLGEALTMLRDAEAALKRYRPPRARLTERKRLPKP